MIWRPIGGCRIPHDFRSTAVGERGYRGLPLSEATAVVGYRTESIC